MKSYIYLISLSIFLLSTLKINAAHFDGVPGYIEEQDEPKLVLGVNIKEGNLDRFDESYAFLNGYQDETSEIGNRAIIADFNSLEHLQELRSSFEGKFQSIVLDDSTYKYTSWTKEHLKIFKQLLAPGGKFIFGPSLVLSTPDFSKKQNFDDALTSLIDSNINKEELCKSLIIPWTILLEAGQFEKDINRKFDIYKEFQKADCKNWNEIASKHQINWRPNKNLLKKPDEKIRDFILNDVARDELTNQVFEILVSDQILAKIQNIFGAANVTLEFNKPLPFRSNYNETQKYLITAISNE